MVIYICMGVISLRDTEYIELKHLNNISSDFSAMEFNHDLNTKNRCCTFRKICWKYVAN